MRTSIPIKRKDHGAIKRSLERALKEALKDRDLKLIMMVKGQLAQYKDVRHG